MPPETRDVRLELLQRLIRDVPDFPKPGILFKDITPVLADAKGFEAALDLMTEAAEATRPDVIAGPESRGFIFGAALASRIGAGFVPIRKRGKLPWRTRGIDYALEYGMDRLEVHEDAARPGQRVLLVDDLLATGGTMAACCRLIEDLGAAVVGCHFLVELAFLSGRGRLPGRECAAVLTY